MKKLLPFVLVLWCFCWVGCSNEGDSPGTGPSGGERRLQPVVKTTLEQTWVPLPVSGGFALDLGPGEPHKVFPVPGSTGQGQGAFWSLSYWFVSTDQHVADEESPARLHFFDAQSILFGMLTGAYAPQEDLSPHLWNATILTANGLMQNYDRVFDQLLSLGDGADNGSGIEFKWFFEILEGPDRGFIRPDTGDLNLTDDGRNLGARCFGSQDAFDPYDRPGFPNSNADFPARGLRTPSGGRVPWFTLIGNHDALHMGNFWVDSQKHSTSPLNNFFFDGSVWLGSESPFGYVLGMPTLIINTLEGGPTPPQAFYDMIGGPGIGGLLSKPLSMELVMLALTDGKEAVRAEMDPNFSFDQVEHSPSDADPSEIGVRITPDRDREFQGMQGLMALARPGGHGFLPNNDECNALFPDGVDPEMGYYTLDIKTAQGGEVPIRVIFLNTDESPIAAEGGMSATQYRWLECQLDRAQRDGYLAIVASHHPSTGVAVIEDEDPDSFICIGPGACKTLLVDTLQKVPNVILHLVGHGHVNKITPHPHQTDPSLSYWEVQTSSTSYWPQQSRVVEVVAYENGVGEIWCTMVDHQPLSSSAEVNLLTQLARYVAVNDPQLPLFQNGLPSGGGIPDDRNRVLSFQIPPEVMALIEALAPSLEITSRDVFPNGQPQLPPPPPAVDGAGPS